MIVNSNSVLTTEELQQLSWRFEHQIKQALKNPCDLNQACAGLKSVAEALGDIAQYERGTLIAHPEPSARQLGDIVEFALSINELDRAEHWLEHSQWQQDQGKQKSWRKKLLKKRQTPEPDSL